MKRYTENELQEIIERDYGFKKELITNPKVHGLWHVSFEVNGIKYYGSTVHAGALPQLAVGGYSSPYFEHDVPVCEEYYKDHIWGKRIIFRHCIDPEGGERENLDKEFANQEEAKQFIAQMSDSEMYDYDFYD